MCSLDETNGTKLFSAYVDEDAYIELVTAVSIAAKNSPKVPLQKSPGVGNFKLALLSASRKFPRTSVC